MLEARRLGNEITESDVVTHKTYWPLFASLDMIHSKTPQNFHVNSFYWQNSFDIGAIGFYAVNYRSLFVSTR